MSLHHIPSHCISCFVSNLTSGFLTCFLFLNPKKTKLLWSLHFTVKKRFLWPLRRTVYNNSVVSGWKT